MRTLRRLVSAATSAAVIAGGSLLAAPVAMAAPPPEDTPSPLVNFDPKRASDPNEAVGHRVHPGQPYDQNPDPAYDWLGSYEVNGKQVWCIQFALTAPNTDEEYKPGDELLDKWGNELKPGTAANISYLLLRYGDTQSADEGAALAHLLHSWTANDPSKLDPSLGFEEIAYDIKGHFAKLPQSAKDKVNEMRAEAKQNRGPWEAALTAPKGEQVIGESAEWTLEVTRPEGKGVSDVPVKLHVQDAEVEGLGEDNVVRTPEDGSPLKLKVTPTGPNPKITGELSAPADTPNVQEAVNRPNTTQRVVSTGGEKQLSVDAGTTAVTAPGSMHLVKVDAESQDGIGGVSLKVTGPDKSSPATKQNGQPLVGPDGKPVVVSTKKDGSIMVPDLKTPQQVCVVETAPAKGYEDAFDKSNPPADCGKVTPGGTLELNLANKANTPSVPVVIPAGDGSTAAGADNGGQAGLLGFGGLALAGVAGVGFALHRKVAKQ